MCAPSMVPWAHPSPDPKRHLDLFSHFCTPHNRDRPTDRPTDRPRCSICSNKLCLSSAVMWPSNKYDCDQLVKQPAAPQLPTVITLDFIFVPMLRDLHWLRSPERIDFKLAVLVYRCLRGLAPRYLSDHMQLVADSNRRPLRSSSSMQLVIQRTRLSTVVRFRWPDAAFGTVCHLTSRPLQHLLFFGIASKPIFFSGSFPL